MLLWHMIGLHDAIYVLERLQESMEFPHRNCFLLISCSGKNSQAADNESPLSATPSPPVSPPQLRPRTAVSSAAAADRRQYSGWRPAAADAGVAAPPASSGGGSSQPCGRQPAAPAAAGSRPCNPFFILHHCGEFGQVLWQLLQEMLSLCRSCCTIVRRSGRTLCPVLPTTHATCLLMQSQEATRQIFSDSSAISRGDIVEHIKKGADIFATYVVNGNLQDQYPIDGAPWRLEKALGYYDSESFHILEALHHGMRS